MRTMLRAAILVFSIGTISAHADDGDGYSPTTLFTSIPGEQASWVATPLRRAAITIPNATAARGYVTSSRRGNWLFLPAPDSGDH
jgi:hypothetical protein